MTLFALQVKAIAQTTPERDKLFLLYTAESAFSDQFILTEGIVITGPPLRDWTVSCELRAVS